MMQSPDMIAAIERLHLAARTLTSSGTLGIHSGNRHGTSTDFVEHRAYLPGDDTKHLDWRAFAKTQKLHTKRYEDETSLRLWLVLDASGSMNYASSAVSKWTRATEFAAALAYLAIKQGDAVGMITGSADGVHVVPATKGVGHLHQLLSTLANAQPQGATSLVPMATRALDGIQRNNTVTVILSDLFDTQPTFFKELSLLAQKLGDLRVLQILDPTEISFPFEHPSTFVSMESSSRMFTHPRSIRQAYLKAMHDFLQNAQQSLHKAGIVFTRADTHQSPRTVLEHFIGHGQTTRIRRL